MVSRQLLQLDASGCKFTWSNGQYAHGLIRKKLDRALCNMAWRQTFEDLLEISLVLIVIIACC